MTSPSDRTSFMPLASGPRQPAYWQPPTGPAPANGGWGQPDGPWTNRPVPPVHGAPVSVPPGTLDTGGRRPPEQRIRLLLIGLIALMAVAAGVLGVLYVGASSDAATANSALANARAEARSATEARDKAEGRATTAEDERDSARTTTQNLQACQQAAKDLIVALNGPNNQATTDAATEALNRMARECQ